MPGSQRGKRLLAVFSGIFTRKFHVSHPVHLSIDDQLRAKSTLFFGDDDGQMVALDAKNGKHLWHFQMGDRLTASPISYAVDGKQYVAIASAKAIFAFGLFEPAQSVAIPATK